MYWLPFGICLISCPPPQQLPVYIIHIHPPPFPDAPLPDVSTNVSKRPIQCGQAIAFSCSAYVIDKFALSPVVTWLDPSNETVGNQWELNVQNGSSRLPAGMYTCKACVTVAKVGIIDLCNITTIPIRYTGQFCLSVCISVDHSL